MLIRDLNYKQREMLQKICRERLSEYQKGIPTPISVMGLTLWDKAFSEGVRAVLARVDKLND